MSNDSLPTVHSIELACVLLINLMQLYKMWQAENTRKLEIKKIINMLSDLNQ